MRLRIYLPCEHDNVEILTTSDDSVTAMLSWQQHMKQAIRSADELLRCVGLVPGSVELSSEQGNFPVFAPKPFLERIEFGKANDPLLRQVLPLADEADSPPHFSTDPLDEKSATLSDGLLQKYRHRVLVIASAACAINCRYCFRRHFPYETAAIGDHRWSTTLERIASDPTVNEVILSGGDPLTVSDEKLENVFERLISIPQLTRVRIHTRLPIVIPQRVTPGLIDILNRFRNSRDDRQVIFVVHSNHANEIDEQVAQSLQDLGQATTQLLNQSVLLAGVNDDSQTLIALSEVLMASGVLPYYLHQLDPIQGTSHFEVAIERGISIIEQMRAQLPGFGVPRYVKEIAGQPNKTVLA